MMTDPAHTTDLRIRLDARARELAAQGMSAAAIAARLEAELPGLRLTDGPEWRRDAPYANPAANAVMARRAQERRCRPAPQGRPLLAVVPPAATMSPGLVAFAEARGLHCAYCGRAGSRGGDPDGVAWARDAVPAGFRVAGRDLELACSRCKADANRYARLEVGDDDIV